MSGNESRIRLELTPEQRALLKRATGKDYYALELNPQELEAQRVSGLLYD
jgi:hypothetical protein